MTTAGNSFPQRLFRWERQRKPRQEHQAFLLGENMSKSDVSRPFSGDLRSQLVNLQGWFSSLSVEEDFFLWKQKH